MTSCNSTDQHICDEIQVWVKKSNEIYLVYLKLSLYADCIILVVSLIVLARVIFIFKRRDWFLILTPAFFLLYGIFYIPYDYLTRYHKSNSKLAVAGYFC